MKVARILIAGERSGVGKSTVVTGIIRALADEGMKVQPFKVGPDYIDPSHHTMAIGEPSRNLDTWLMGERGVVESFLLGSKGKDLAVIEGAMGLYDGFSGSYEGSSAHIAKLTSTPVVLLVNASKIAGSIAALVSGYKSFDPELSFAGVILNGVGSESHARMLGEAIESRTGLPLLGWLPKSSEIEIPERHLGLIPAAERQEEEVYLKLAEFVREHVDLEAILRAARDAPPLPEPPAEEEKEPTVRVGVALDKAFSFYYWENFELMRREGAEVVFFSPISDNALPDVDGLYIGGGFPEVYASEIAQNRKLMREIRKKSEEGMPIYAECGGMMYLTRELLDLEGNAYEMTGIFDAVVEMTPKLQAVRYTLARAARNTPFFCEGDVLKGHEFHYSRIADFASDISFAYSLQRGMGIADHRDGFISNATLASYMHLHFAGSRDFLKSFIAACAASR
jgi:cobyrinic acid a,c-diamide synthase